MKEIIDPFQYAPAIFANLPQGILLTTSHAGKVNTMTIGWGAMAIEWRVPIFIVYVRENRHTTYNLVNNPEFTINSPVGEYTTADKKIAAFAGAKSGRDVDKIAHLNLQPEKALQISTPGLRDFPLTFECRVIYHRKQDPAGIEERFKTAFYPQNVDSSFPGANRDYHIAWYGEIVSAYIIK